MADSTGIKGGVILALVVFAGWTYWNRQSDASEAKSVCLSQVSSINDVSNPDAFCGCVVEQQLGQTSFIYHVPIIKNFLGRSSAAAVYAQAVRTCAAS